jgi:DNA-directed RNA polymerase alpha subunit
MTQSLLSCVESRIEHNRSFYSRFQLGPFDLGQGLTIGNAFRRTLLSELSGVGITLIEIDGVCHEYSTLPGVRESVLDILLNLKQLVLTSNTKFTAPQVGYLRFTGPGTVMAKDLHFPSSVYCVDPDQVIATLSADATLNFKFLVCQGKNYIIQTPIDKFHQYQKKILSTHGNATTNLVSQSSSNWGGSSNPAENNSFRQNPLLKSRFQQLQQLNRLKEKSFKAYKTPGELTGTNPPSEVGALKNITTFDLRENKLSSSKANPTVKNVSNSATQALPLDTLFMPIKKVNYMIDIDPAEPDRESVILEIWTNGSIHPRQAIHEATKQLINLFSPFLQTNLVPTKVTMKADASKARFAAQQTAHSRVTFTQQTAPRGSKQQKLLAAIKTLDIANLDFSLKTFAALKKANINTVNELLVFRLRGVEKDGEFTTTKDFNAGDGTVSRVAGVDLALNTFFEAEVLLEIEKLLTALGQTDILTKEN